MIDNIPNEIINWSILNEIISMDDDDPNFSKSLITQYFDQVIQTFNSMEEQLHTTRDLKELDSLGHFLKGSSAALGLQRIAWVCERIQNLGRKLEDNFPSKSELLKNLQTNLNLNEINLMDSNCTEPTIEIVDDDSKYLSIIESALSQARIEFKLARNELSNYYQEQL